MASDAQLAQEQYEHYRYCRVEGGHDRFLLDMEEAKRYYASHQWKDTDYKERTDAGRLSFVVNEIFRTINAVRGELNQLISDVRFDPTNGDDGVARVLNRLNEHVDRDNKMFMHDDRVLLDGLLGGRGFYRTRVKFDENMQGWISVARQRPENVILDNIDSPDPDTWDRVFTTEVVSTDDVENMYGAGIAKQLGDMPYEAWLDLEDRTLAQSLGRSSMAHAEEITGRYKLHRLLSHQFREYRYKDCFVDRQTGDISEIPETWPREKIQSALQQFGLGVVRKKRKTLRWRVSCNGVILHDEDSPYKYFDIVPYMPWFLDGMALSLFTVLKGPQDLLNYTVSEETHILGTTSHSGWKLKQGSLKNMTPRQLERKAAKSGIVLELEDISDAEKILPGQPATGFERFGDRARSWINDLGSVSPSMLGQQGEYANGKNIKGNLSRAPVNLHAPLVMFQYTKQLLAERKLDLFQTYYTETRVLKIAGSGYGQPETVGINVPAEDGRIINNLSVGKYTVRMMPVGSRMAADEFAFDELKAMKLELGINVPNSLFVSTSSLNAKSEVIEQLIAANGGELNPAEQKQQELQMRAMELDNVDKEATIDGKHAAAELARGRAKRADMDASFDPRVHRAQADQARIESEHQRALLQLEQKRSKDSDETAVKLTQIAASTAVAESKQAVDKSKKEAAPKTAKPKTPPK